MANLFGPERTDPSDCGCEDPVTHQSDLVARFVRQSLSACRLAGFGSYETLSFQPPKESAATYARSCR